MRPSVPPPPADEELRRLAVHEVVRDFPETLAVFRSRQIDVRTAGPWSVSRLLEEDPGDPSLLRDLQESLEWRRGT